jgi:hypothetical protein
MIGRRSPRRFNVLTKATIVKALMSCSRKPKYVGFRQNPVASVHKVPVSHGRDDDDTTTTTTVGVHDRVATSISTMTMAQPPHHQQA